MKRHAEKIIALALVLLVLLNITNLKGAYAQPDSSKDLEKWLLDNLNILGLTMHRGSQYSMIGNYLEPTISFLVSDYNNKTSLAYPKKVSMKLSDYVNYVQNNKLILQMNITYFGYNRTGPITAVWPPFSYIYERAFNDTSALGWGTYLTSNLPPYYMKSNEAEPYTINYFEWNVRSVFHENPEYLYEILILGNGSNVKLPKGENILLALSPYKLDISVYDLIKSALKGGSMPYPNYPDQILKEFPSDDTSAGLLYIVWEVEGNSGYLEPATVLNYTHPIVSKITFTHYADGLMRLQNESKEQWYTRTVQYDMERINKLKEDFHVSYDMANTSIFAPFGSPTKSFSTYIDLSNKDAISLFKSTAVYYIIDPKVYNGQDKIKLTISDSKGRINLTYEFNIEIDKERFVIKDINLVNTYTPFTYDRSKTFFVGDYGFEDPNLQAINTIIMHSEKSYNEDGSLSLKLNYKQNSQFFGQSSDNGSFILPGGQYISDSLYEASSSSSGYETGTINVYIGGWLPNPQPATTSTFDFSSSSSGHSSYQEQLSWNYILSFGYSYSYMKFKCTVYPGSPYCSWGEIDEVTIAEGSYVKPGSAYYFGFGYSNIEYNIDSGLLIIKDNKLIFKVAKYGSYYMSGFASYSEGAMITKNLDLYNPYPPDALPETAGNGTIITIYHYIERSPDYISSSFSSETSQNYGWTIFEQVSEYNLTQLQPIEITESTTLLISLDSRQAMVDEEITGYIISYGKNAIGSTVSLNAYVEFNNTKVPVTVNPNKLTVSEGKNPSFTLKMPSYATLRSKFGENMPTRLTVTINAIDSRGVNATEYIILNARGYFIVLDFKDVDLNIPNDPWKSNVLEDALLINTTKPLQIMGFFLYISILEKGTMKEVYKDEVKNSRYVIIYDPSVFEKGKTYILNYTLYYFNGKQFKVIDAAIDIKIPDQIPEDKNYVKYSVYVPHSLFMRYQKYADALKGNDQKYKILLADPKLVLDYPLRSLLTYILAIANEDYRPFFTALYNSLDDIKYHIGPKIALPEILTEDAKDSELAIFSQPFNFRDLNYRLYEDGFHDPANYWSKLSKVIILEAEMLRNYKYAESLTLIVARIAALLITLEMFQNNYIKDSSNGKPDKINLFTWFEKKFGAIDKNKLNMLNKLDAFKIGALTTEGALLTILNLPYLKDAIMTPIINNFLSKVVGKENVPILIALSFKIIRFSLTAFLSEGRLAGDFAFEVIFQVISFIIAHILMMIHNFFNQLLVFIELGRVSLANLLPTFNVLQGAFIVNQFRDFSYSELRKQIVLPVSESSWNKRNEQKGVADLSPYSYFETTFYAAADAYLVVDSITGMIISIVRGFDGIKFKLGAKGVENGKIAEKILDLSKILSGQFKLNIGGKQIGANNGAGFTKKDITRFYLAFIAGMLVDNIIKLGWIYTFYLLIIYSNILTEALATLAFPLQAALPLVVFIKAAQVNKKGVEKKSQETLELSDEDAKSLKSLADEISSSGSKLNDMINTFYYDSKFFEELIGYLRDADLLLIRSYYRITDANGQLKMQELKISYENEFADLMLLLFAIVNAPSSRSLALETEYISSKINSIAGILYNASRLVNNATINNLTLGKIGPLVVVNPSDVFVNFYPITNKINVIISNVGDEDVNVNLKLLETNATGSYSSNVVSLKARSTEVITLEPIKKASNSESVDAILLVYVNDQLLYDLMINIPLTLGPYSASSNGIEVYSDGPVSISDKGISVINSTLVQILLPKGDSRYVALLDGKMIRSAEIYGDNYTILAVAFNKPVSGIITYKSIKQNVEYLEGTGTVKGKTGVTIESSGAFQAQVSLLYDNPYPEASLEGSSKYKIISIDLLSAQAGYVTVKISYEDLGISDPSQIRLYKYNATSEAYQEVKNYQIDTNEKVVIFTLRPGDPVFALTSGAINTGGPNQSGWQFSMNIFDIKTMLLILVIAMLAVVTVLVVRKAILKKHKEQ